MLQPRTVVWFAGWSLAGTLAAQTACLDQFYQPFLFNGVQVTGTQSATQTFTVGQSGVLAQVEASSVSHWNGVTTSMLRVAIVTTNGGVPNGTTLASIDVPPSAISVGFFLPPAPVLVDFTPFQLSVQAGQVLGIELSCQCPPGGPNYAWFGLAPGGTYANGLTYLQQTTPVPVCDLAFRTFVLSPATWTNYGAGHPGTNGVPSLTSSGNPKLGTTPSVLIGNSAGAPTLASLFVGLMATSFPTPFGGTALVVPITNFVLFVPTGGGQVPIPLPNDPTFCGFVLDMQAVVVDGGASQSIAFTPGLEFVLGS